MAQPSAYQRVSSEYDVTEAGVDSLWYLDFDGVDDGLATGSIDFTSTDEMSVFGAISKEETGNVYWELSASWTANAGTFIGIANTSSGASDYAASSKGGAGYTAALDAKTDDSQPDTVVQTSLHDISGDSTILRINGSEIAEATADQGSGNFGNYPLNIGARNNAASLFFDGRIYGLIVRGATSTAGEISNTETFLADRSGVTL